MTYRILLISLFLFSLAGCAGKSGFKSDEMHGLLNAAPEVDEVEIEKILALKPQLPLPFKVGIYFKQPESRGGWKRSTWRWTEADKQKILTSAEKMKEAGQISQIFVITEGLTAGSDMKSLRLAAARHGADALMIVDGIADTDDYNNNLGWTYLGLITTFFVPGSQTDVLFLTKAALWDVRNQYLYMSAEAESEQSEAHPAAFFDDKRILEQAKQASLSKLGDAINRLTTEWLEKANKGPKVDAGPVGSGNILSNNETAAL